MPTLDTSHISPIWARAVPDTLVAERGEGAYLYTTAGAEILEASVKLAKHATKRTNVIVFSGSFHGRTHLTMAMTTSKTVYRVGYQPLVPGIFVTPYPYAYKYGLSDDEVTDYCLPEL